MAFRAFSTEAADYLLLLEGHFRAANEAVISSRLGHLDAVVLEHIELGGTGLEDARQQLYRLVNTFNPDVHRWPDATKTPDASATGCKSTTDASTGRKQSENAGARQRSVPKDQLGELGDLIERHARRSGGPFDCYIVDVNLTGPGLYGSYATTVATALAGAVLVARGNRTVKLIQAEARTLTRRELLWVSGLVGCGLFLLGDLIFSPVTGVVSGALKEPWSDILSLRMQLTPTPLVELRNAVLARKLEDHVVPALKKRLGRRPNLAIFYGGRHLSIESYLCSRFRRDALLESWKALGYPGVVKVHLNRLLTLTYTPASKSDGTWSLNATELPAFSMGE